MYYAEFNESSAAIDTYGIVCIFCCVHKSILHGMVVNFHGDQSFVTFLIHDNLWKFICIVFKVRIIIVASEFQILDYQLVQYSYVCKYSSDIVV